MARNPAYEQGRNAFRLNMPNNPNREGTIAHKEFMAGYDAEYFFNLKSITSHHLTKETL